MSAGREPAASGMHIPLQGGKEIHEMLTTLEDQQITVRSAAPNEVTLVLSFIKKKAAFDRNMGSFSGTLQTSEEKVHQTILGPQPFASFLIAESVGQPVGFALYYFRYSSFAGQPSVWLDDLYVNEEMRSRGAGVALMRGGSANCPGQSLYPYCLDG